MTRAPPQSSCSSLSFAVLLVSLSLLYLAQPPGEKPRSRALAKEARPTALRSGPPAVGSPAAHSNRSARCSATS